MNIIPLSACSVPPGSCPVVIGRRGENGVTQVTLDFSTWLSDFGSGAISLLVRRFGDSASYPVLLDVDGADAVWTVSATDTDSAGLGTAEYVYTVGQTVKKSAVFPIQVLADIGQPRTTPPDPYETWVDTLTDLGALTLQNAQEAARSAADAEIAQGKAEDAQEAAEEAQRSAETAKRKAEAAQEAAEDAQDAAEDAAERAEQGANTNGWVSFYIDASGNLHYIRTAYADIDFYIDENGHLHATNEVRI